MFFWAPTSKWLFSVSNLKVSVLASTLPSPLPLHRTLTLTLTLTLMQDLNKDTDKMSFAQMSALTATGVIWTRYSFVINPVNYNLATVNLALGLSSGYHLARKVKKDYMS